VPGVVYASTANPQDPGFGHLDRAVAALLDSVGEQLAPKVLWRLRYQQRTTKSQLSIAIDDGTIMLPALSRGLALDDSITDEIRSIWSKITGEAEESFMNFDAREGLEDEDTFG
jgi:hypothetical protein